MKLTGSDSFMKCDTFDEFERQFIFLHKQKFALKEKRSYLDFRISNMDGTFYGEEFDNDIRISFLKRNNQCFYEIIDEKMMIDNAKEIYEQDKMKCHE